MEKVIQEVRGYEEFKDYSLDSFLKETTTQRGMHDMKDFPFGEEKTQMILVNKSRYEELLKRGVSSKEILYDEILKRENPEQYKKQARLRTIQDRFHDVVDRKQNLDETFAALLYMVHYVEEEIRYLFVELKGGDPKEIEESIKDVRDYATRCSIKSWELRHG